MSIVVDKGSGFCFGVKRAIDMAEEALQQGQKLYCLGQIVHNEEENKRLQELGLVIIDQTRYRTLSHCKVLIRAHGEPPVTYQLAQQNGITLIDATCPIVAKLQKRIHKVYHEEQGSQVVIYGKAGHPEVVGLNGHAANNATIVTSAQQPLTLDASRPVYLFSQTTRDEKGFFILRDRIDQLLKQQGDREPETLHVANTICRQMANREPNLRRFAKEHDIIVFVSGRNSSNGKMLFEVCRQENEHAVMISSAAELMAQWFVNKNSIGVAGATSTPQWLMDQVAHEISLLIKK